MENTVSLTINKCDEETFKELGKKLKLLRTSRGVSQQTLSEITNRDRSGLSGYERGVKIPTIYSLCDISNALDCDFKIQFKTRKGLNNMDRDNFFTEDFVETFMENMKETNTQEYSLAETIKALDDEWNTIEFSKDKVVMKSNKESIFEITKLTLDTELNSDKFYSIEVKYKNKEDEEYRSFKTFTDSSCFYSLDLASDIEQNIITCIGLEGILDSCMFLNDYEKFINKDAVQSFQYNAYMSLKRAYFLKDTDILDIIKILDIEVEQSTFLDVLKCSRDELLENDTKLQVALIFAIDYYLKEGYVDEEVLGKIIRLSHLFRLDHYLSIFLYTGGNEVLESKITPEPANKICSSIIFNETLSTIEECFKYLNNMKNRNKSKNEFHIIMDLVYAFFNGVNTTYASDMISETIYELSNFEYDFNC